MPNQSDAIHPKADPRIAVRLRARISTIDPETDPFTGKPFFRTCEETSANVSKGGVFVSMRETIAPGRRLLVELSIPGGQTVQAVGRVAWTRATLGSSPTTPAGNTGAGERSETGIWIEFLGGARDELHALERFVSRATRARKSERSSTAPAHTAAKQG